MDGKLLMTLESLVSTMGSSTVSLHLSILRDPEAAAKFAELLTKRLPLAAQEEAVRDQENKSWDDWRDSLVR